MVAWSTRPEADVDLIDRRVEVEACRTAICPRRRLRGIRSFLTHLNDKQLMLWTLPGHERHICSAECSSYAQFLPRTRKELHDMARYTLDRRALLTIGVFGAMAAMCTGSALAQQTASTAATLFTNVNVFDGKNETLINNANVLIEGNLIKTISTSPINAEDATVIDGGGRTLMPGLIDMHWHSNFATLGVQEGLDTDLAYHALKAAKANNDALLRGFTSVRDMAGNSFSLHKLTDAGVYDGPRMFPSGPAISQTSGHSDWRPATGAPFDIAAPLDYVQRSGHFLIADGVPEVLKRTREALRMGATQIKVMAGGGVSSNFDPLDVTQYSLEELEAAVEAAREWNTYVGVHVFTDVAAQQAIAAGVKSIEHGHLLHEETLKMMVEKGVFLSMQPILDDEDAIPFPPGSANQAKFEQVTQGTENVYPLAKRLGVKIVFGTDTLFDPELAKKQGKQLAKLGRWFTPVEALRQATSTAGELLALSGPRNPYQAGPLGVIEEGAYADLILVDGNPLENLDLVADPEANFDLIMKDGKIYKKTID
ncbi:metal-dependent hydrolase family protein [Mesorhizobium marinum]|uniref:metal-dependent hydrolase family protein n=1 Tax=Mesorhizobium marinum TaxID=3228790 RepID=UPI003465193F